MKFYDTIMSDADELEEGEIPPFDAFYLPPRERTGAARTNAAFEERRRVFQTNQRARFDTDYEEFVALFEHFKDPTTSKDFIRGSKRDAGTAWFRDKKYTIGGVEYGFHYGNSMQLAYRVDEDTEGKLTWRSHASVQLLNRARALLRDTEQADVDTPEKALVRAFENEEKKNGLCVYEGRKFGLGIRY